MNILSFGGGTNSTAMLIGLRNEGVKIDAILFADTGAETPETYRHITEMNKWLIKNNMPEITIVKRKWKHDGYKTLEEECLEKKILPSIAYGGFKTCSINYKIAPQEKWCNEHCKHVWDKGKKVNRYIGYDFGEPQRREHARTYDRVNAQYNNIYPMVDDWEWDREKCIEVIQSEGLVLPNKSSCFFCPNMRKREIVDLYLNNKELFERAVYMEQNADLTSLKGLGRQWSWGIFVDNFNNVYDKIYGSINLTNKQLDQAIEDCILKSVEIMKNKEKQISKQSSLCDFMSDDDDKIPCGCYD